MVHQIGDQQTMRRALYRAHHQTAIDLFRRSEVIHLATTTGEGHPISRTLHGVVVGDHVLWHGAPKGEKSDVAGRLGVISCDRVVATIPSWFVDPELACPATTYYESAQAAGTIEAVTDLDKKAAGLAALMDRYQPEGGFVPIRADDPRYAAVVKNIGLWRVSLADAVAKVKLGQNRKPEQMKKIVEAMWRRGAARDVSAIERLLAANPETPVPSFFEGPAGLRFCLPGPEDLDDAVALLRDAYWNVTNDDASIRAAHVGSPVWVGARDETGRLVATARAITDRGKHAWVYDVMVAEAWRGRGVGEAVMRLLLDHPWVRSVRRVLLGTLDAQPFYRRLGFEVRETTGPTPGTTVMMLCLGTPTCTSEHDGSRRRNASGSAATAGGDAVPRR